MSVKGINKKSKTHSSFFSRSIKQNSECKPVFVNRKDFEVGKTLESGTVLSTASI